MSINEFANLLTAEHNNPHIFVPVYYEARQSQLFLKRCRLIFSTVNGNVILA